MPASPSTGTTSPSTPVGGLGAEAGWVLTAPRPFSVVCFRREASDEEKLKKWLEEISPDELGKWTM